LPCLRAAHRQASQSRAFTPSPAAQAAFLRPAPEDRPLQRRCRMSAALAMPVVLHAAQAVAELPLPFARARTIQGYAFYRKHTVALLRRYLRVSMALGRTPSLLGNLVFRGRASSYRMTTFEDLMIFVLDIEKCLMQLDRASQAVIAHIALEYFTALETAAITKDSLRSVTRIYGVALDHLTRQFLDFGLLDLNVENLSRGTAKN
jgi:hypothetical protein